MAKMILNNFYYFSTIGTILNLSLNQAQFVTDYTSMLDSSEHGKWTINKRMTVTVLGNISIGNKLVQLHRRFLYRLSQLSNCIILLFFNKIVNEFV